MKSKFKFIFILVMVAFIYSQSKYVNYGLPYYSIQLSTRIPKSSDAPINNLQQSVIRASIITKTKVEFGIEFAPGKYVSDLDIEDTQISQLRLGLNFHNKGPNSPFTMEIGGKYKRTNYENYNSTYFTDINIDEDAEDIYSNAGIIDISIYEPIFQKGKLILIPFFNFNYEIRVLTSSNPAFGDEFDKSSEARFIGTSFGLGLRYDKYFLETTLNETEGLSNFWFKIGKLFHAKRK